jgi:hypothetical protein
VHSPYTIDSSGAELKVDKEVHDYGTIQQGANGECFFVITNTGTEPLVISECRGSCSCTVPDWPKEPIAPGKSATIKVKYDTNRVGPINKTVRVTSNATNSPLTTLTIKGNVVATISHNHRLISNYEARTRRFLLMMC